MWDHSTTDGVMTGKPLVLKEGMDEERDYKKRMKQSKRGKNLKERLKTGCRTKNCLDGHHSSKRQMVTLWSAVSTHTKYAISYKM